MALWTVGSSVHGILQARVLEWGPSPPPGGLPHPGIESTPIKSPALADGFFTTSTTWEAQINLPESQSYFYDSGRLTWC